MTLSATDSLPMHLAWFENQGVKGEPALGDPETTTWGNFVSVITSWRREGPKDGPNFIPVRIQPEPNDRRVRRLGRNVVARTAAVLDIEAHKKSGEVPPPIEDVIRRLRGRGWAGFIYTSHSHAEGAVRYRVGCPLSQEIDPQLPAPEVMAEELGLVGVLDMSKTTPASLFFLPSCGYGESDRHHAVAIPGDAIDATWMRDRAGALLTSRQAEQDRVAAEAAAEAAARRQAKLDAGFNSDDGLIEKIRAHLNLDSVLTSHGYDKAGSRYRHPNSESRAYGATIKVLGGVERLFSHNGTDPLHADSLPEWCGVRAIDAFDVVTILDFGADRTRALRELADRFNLIKAAERKALASLLFRMMRQQVSQAEIEAAALAEGVRTGLSRDEVIRVAVWVASQPIATREAA